MTRPVPVATAAALAAAVAGCGDADRAPEPARAPAAFSARLVDDVEPLRGGLVSWSTDWELAWRRVPGAREYLVYTGTSEGDATSARRTTDPRFRLRVANGVDRRSLRRIRRDQQVALVAAELSVSVAARLDDGRTTPRAGPFPVGEPPPG